VSGLVTHNTPVSAEAVVKCGTGAIRGYLALTVPLSLLTVWH